MCRRGTCVVSLEPGKYRLARQVIRDGLLKVTWIAGMGAGLTLAMIGLVALATTSGKPRAVVTPWGDGRRGVILLPCTSGSRREDGSERLGFGLTLHASF